MTTQNTEDNAPQWRARLRASRAELTVAERGRYSLLMRARLFTWLANYRHARRAAGQPAPACIAGFWPMAEEPDLRPLLGQWAEDAELTVALPVVDAPGRPLSFHRWSPDTPMATGAYGIDIPALADPVIPDVVLVPTLGFTPLGDRLGYGAGFYDRTLAALHTNGRPLVTLGIAWACGEMDDTYRPAPHDQRLDAIMTHEAWMPAAPGSEPTPPSRSLFFARV